MLLNMFVKYRHNYPNVGHQVSTLFRDSSQAYLRVVQGVTLSEKRYRPLCLSTKATEGAYLLLRTATRLSPFLQKVKRLALKGGPPGAGAATSVQ